MKTLEEIYTEVLADEELQTRLQVLHTPEEQTAFVKELGGEASAEEIAAFLAKKNSPEGELSDDELDQVVGGKDGNVDKNATYIHNNCGGRICYEEGTFMSNEQWVCNKCGESNLYLSSFSYSKQ